MIFSEHANKRQQQRNITDMMLEVIEGNGRVEYTPGGALKVFFGNKEYKQTISELKRIIKLVERARGGTMILANDTVLTVYRKH